MKTLAALLFFALSVAFALIVPDKLIAAGERYRANQKATAAVEEYSTKRATKDTTKVTVVEGGEHITLSGKFRKKMYNISYLVNNKPVTQQACVTVELRKNSEEKAVELKAWPNKEGKMDIIPL